MAECDAKALHGFRQREANVRYDAPMHSPQLEQGDRGLGRRSFRSDNNAGLCPEALEAIQRIGRAGHVIGYGDDELTQQAVQAFRDLFGSETTVFFVATGTAANTLAVAALTEPWQQVICHANCHFNFDESTAPERITHCRVVQVREETAKSSLGEVTGKLVPEAIKAAAIGSRGDVHHPQPGVVTISNSTEFGTVYSPEEVGAICAKAHEMGYRVHMDGARFANAVASLGCSPRELANEAGIDALSFGGTKNGLAFGEAVLFFPQGDGSGYEHAVRTFPFHRKGTGHLLSKHRFVSAPFAATLADGAWLRHAAHANDMARALSNGLTSCGIVPAFPVQANAVFVRLPVEVDQRLRDAGHGYYAFEAPRPDDTVLVRLMCSFDTEQHEIDRFVADVSQAMRR
jgi:threonine aldolase